MSLTANDQQASQCIKAGRYAPQEPMVALPFCCLLTSVRPTPFPRMSHLSHISHFASYQPMHLINPKVDSSEAGGTPTDTPEQQYNRATPILWGVGVGLCQGRPIRPSRANGGAPVPLPANICLSHPLPTNVPSILSVPSVPFCQLPTNALNQTKSGVV